MGDKAGGVSRNCYLLLSWRDAAYEDESLEYSIEAIFYWLYKPAKIASFSASWIKHTVDLLDHRHSNLSDFPNAYRPYHSIQPKAGSSFVGIAAFDLLDDVFDSWRAIFSASGRSEAWSP